MAQSHGERAYSDLTNRLDREKERPLRILLVYPGVPGHSFGASNTRQVYPQKGRRTAVRPVDRGGHVAFRVGKMTASTSM